MKMGKRQREESKKERRMKKLMKKMKKMIEEDSGSDTEDQEEQDHVDVDIDEEIQIIPEELEVLVPEDEHLDVQNSLPEQGQQEVEQIVQTDIDEEILSILGTIETVKENGPSLHQEIINRFNPILSKGLKKVERNDLIQKYLPFENLPGLIPPKLNPEICAAVSEQVKKRDSIIQLRQKQISASLTALGTSLQLFLTKGDRTEIIKNINDASRLLCDSLCQDTKGRRLLITNVVNKNLKESLTSEPDSWLFGNNLAEKIRNAKAIQKSGHDLKVKPFKPVNMNTKKTLNWRAPPRSVKMNAGGKYHSAQYSGPARHPKAEQAEKKKARMTRSRR